MKSFIPRYASLSLASLLCSTLLHASQPVAIHLNQDQADGVAQKVWKNEANSNLEYLIYWNQHETFLSLGIAHFLWYGKTNRAQYQEMFPLLVDYFVKHNVRLPAWLDSQTPCPWENRQHFMQAKAKNSTQYQELYSLMVRTMPIQVNFIIERLQNAMPKILETLDEAEKRDQIIAAYTRIISPKKEAVSTQGIYMILDYVNFKGEGTSPEEKYQGKGWGLLQVLEEMDPQNKNASDAFVNAAKQVLSRRIQNAPPERNETQWKKGWFKRIDSYVK